MTQESCWQIRDKAKEGGGSLTQVVKGKRVTFEVGKGIQQGPGKEQVVTVKFPLASPQPMDLKHIYLDAEWQTIEEAPAEQTPLNIFAQEVNNQ